jgi:hypothetical protein
MLSSRRKPVLGASTALVVVALVAAMVVVCLVVAAGARSADARPAGAQPPPGGPAVANPLKYVMANSPPNPYTTNPPIRIYKAVAQCPNFYLAISGGFDLHNPISPWRIRASRPANSEEAIPETAWVVEAQKIGTKELLPFTAYAVCVHESLVPRGADQLYYSSSSGQIPGNSKKELTPDCRATHRAIGGGFSFDSKDLHARLIRTQPNPGNGYRSWIVKALNADTSSFRPPPQDLSAYAVCIRQEYLKDPMYDDVPSSDKGVINSNTRPCPENTYLLSGGGGTSDNAADDINWSHIRPGGSSEANPPKTWSSGAYDNRIFQTSKITVHVHALCGRLGSRGLGAGDDKLLGKNPGWGDGMGGGRFK